MEAIYFVIFWIGGALLHTLYDLKVKPNLRSNKQDSKDWKYL